MAVNVRFGSKADIEARQSDVRFTPKSGHWLRALGSPLSAKSGHRSALTRCENPKMIPVARKGVGVAIDASSDPAQGGSHG